MEIWGENVGKSNVESYTVIFKDYKKYYKSIFEPGRLKIFTAKIKTKPLKLYRHAIQ